VIMGVVGGEGDIVVGGPILEAEELWRINLGAGVSCNLPENFSLKDSSTYYQTTNVCVCVCVLG
jgi:hypothetical protein